jgi:ribosomal protein S27AE
MSDHNNYLFKFFVFHNAPLDLSTEYINSIPDIFLSCYSPWHLYCMFIDKEYNNTNIPAHRHIISWNNKREIEESVEVTCYTCKLTYPANTIKNYYQYIEDDDYERNTALCEFCNSDTIIPDKLIKNLTKKEAQELIDSLHKLWISKNKNHTCKRCSEGIFPRQLAEIK